MRKGTQKDYELLFTIFSNFTHLVLKVFNFDLKSYQSKWKAINDIYKNFFQIFCIFKKKKEFLHSLNRFDHGQSKITFTAISICWERCLTIICATVKCTTTFTVIVTITLALATWVRWITTCVDVISHGIANLGWNKYRPGTFLPILGFQLSRQSKSLP